jgi:hypothetical protein
VSDEIFSSNLIWIHYDRELLEGLRKRGFRTNKGYKDTSGATLLAWTKGGGYYLGAFRCFLKDAPVSYLFVETGASQLIIDGKIKLKNDSQIKTFTENSLQFENGSELPADVVVFCTGSASYV